MPRKPIKKLTKKPTNWLSTKASSLRSDWKRRLLKAGLSIEELPTTQEIKEYLKQKEPFTCEYDLTPLEQKDIGFDHNVPVSRGGSYSLDNIVICSKVHNLSKGDMTGDEYKELLSFLRKWPDKGEKLLTRLRMAGTIFIKRNRYKKKK